MKNILFICNANTFRSQAAAALANKLLNVNASSAGISDKNAGKKVVDAVTPETRVRVLPVLQKQGIDISNNVCRIATKEMVDRADLVFVMEESQKLKMQEMFPESADKIYVLGVFAHLENPDIPDAGGKDSEFHLFVFNEVKRAIEIIKEKNLLKSLS